MPGASNPPTRSRLIAAGARTATMALLGCGPAMLYTAPRRSDKRRRGLLVRGSLRRSGKDQSGRLLLSRFLHDAALGLTTRLLLAADELAVALAEVESVEEIGAILEDQSREHSLHMEVMKHDP